MKELKGKVALVTGASRGLGKGIALVLAEKGAAVVVNYRSAAAEADEVVEAVRAAGGTADAFRADVSDAEETDRLFGFLRDRHGKIDILVNNAGTTKAQDLFDITEDDWDFILKTNLKSLYLCTRRALVMMREKRSGRIVNLSSVVAHRGAQFGHAHYATTKGGILSFTRTVARTGAPYGITCNAVAPGIIETELLFQTHGAEAVAKIAETVPLGLGKPRDVGLAVAYLAGEGGSYLTGICLDVNGGMYFH